MKHSYAKAAAFAVCCLLKLNAVVAAVDKSFLEDSRALSAANLTAKEEIALVRAEVDATNECSAIEDSLGCKVDDYCQCNGKDYSGCTQCHYGSSCNMLDTKASICMPLPPDDIKSHHTGTNCVVDDYAQCGGTDYDGCQRCKAGSTCLEEFEGDESFLLCVPKKTLNAMKGKPGLDDEKVRKVAKLMSGVDEQLDKDADDEEMSLEEIRAEEMHVIASEKGLKKLKELAMAHDPDYEETEGEVEDNWDDYCDAVSQPASKVSQEIRDCFCKKIDPALHCIAKLGVEFEAYLSERRALEQDDGEEDDGIPFNLEDMLDAEELKKAFGDGTRKLSDQEEAVEEAYKKVQESLEQSPEFHGDVQESLKEARNLAEAALRKVYESDAYDFSEFDSEVGHPFERHLRGGSCSATFMPKRGTKYRNSFAQFWGYANAMITFIQKGQGCSGVDCTIPLQKAPLEVQLSLQACIGTIPSISSIRSGTARHAWASKTVVSLSAKLCFQQPKNFWLKHAIAYFGVDLCFIRGGFAVYPLLGKLEAHIAASFFGLVTAKFSFTILYDDYPTKKWDLCDWRTNSKLECQLCEGGTDIRFEVIANYYFGKITAFHVNSQDRRCGGQSIDKSGLTKNKSAIQLVDEEAARKKREQEAYNRETNRQWGAALRNRYNENEYKKSGKVKCRPNGSVKNSCEECGWGSCGGDCYLTFKVKSRRSGSKCVKKPSHNIKTYSCYKGHQDVEDCKLCDEYICGKTRFGLGRGPVCMMKHGRCTNFD